MSDSHELKIDACFSPYLYPVYKDNDSIVVIIDILRATSAICTAFEHGAEKIIPVATVDEARSYKEKGYMVGAERDGVQVDGFEFGNSPFSYMGEKVKDQTIVITTTNGTQAIEAAKNAYRVVIGSFLNITALCEWLISEKRNILLLCSGWKNKFNLEDALFAGAVSEMIAQMSDAYKCGDACLALKYLYQMAEQDPNKFLKHSSHRERLARLNLKKDIKYCLTHDQTRVIPVLHDGALIRLKALQTA
ncbi:MAG: 2-phosphosulfolactate phosphatase [Bacteroidetes bacterium]|nr:MAG: 2-phosphosulfolactate phosphatase [Bacteroidota bacterium]REK07000.1 MAG: 2-phosphosulfolactate phosphatase [Bacteroidota bacterium]REK33653.1 MAG: 2-phosphosulfolactate phosphatase [Bacteroidota bacterium]REK48639.1 MAG: 2-phosphosulfolactate phosphatase [Bacteroidota bacterium]